MQRSWFIWVLSFVLLVSLCAGGYFVYKNNQFKDNIKTLEKENSHLSESLDFALSEIELKNTDIENLTTERDNFVMLYGSEKQRAEFAELQLGATRDVVSVLEKVNLMDDELLKKYSKVSFLNENYEPKSTSTIPVDYIYRKDREYTFLDSILPYLLNMIDDARAEGVDLSVLSSYRSFGEQSTLKSNYKLIYGSGANKFSADQGYSEHQLGTAVDFTTDKMGTNLVESFENSDTFKWLQNNAYKYGFILSYAHKNNYYQYEPWHWRFIGRDFATRIHEDGKNFYDLDQRLIDTYLISFFD